MAKLVSCAMAISQTRDAQTSTYHYDGLGSTRALSDTTGTNTDAYNYEAFGELETGEGTTENSYLFTGEQYDQSLAQYYLRARYMDPSVERFTQFDSFAGAQTVPGSLHKYLYVANFPTGYTDPSGRTFLASGIANLSLSFGTTTVLRAGSVQAGRTAISSLLWGKPPKDLGLIGEIIFDFMLDAVTETIALNQTWDSKQLFGTAAHQELKSKVRSYSPLPNVDIIAEPFFDAGGGEHEGKGPKGSLGVDVTVKYNKNIVLAMELKTGRGASRPKNATRIRRTGGADFIEVRFDVK